MIDVFKILSEELTENVYELGVRYALPLWRIRHLLQSLTESDYLSDFNIGDEETDKLTGNVLISFEVTQKFIDRWTFEQL